ncbi:MAG: tetratricopeptide repeat protein [Leptospirillia bacterium]
MRQTTLVIALLLAGVWVLGAVGCREESPAMKKANLGRAFMERGDHERAIRTLNEAISLDPELAMSYEILGQTYEAAGRYPEAIQSYRQTVQRDAVRDSAYTALGCLLLATEGARPEAKAALTEAIKLNQADSRSLACMGAFHLDQRELDKAVELSAKAASLNPQNVQAHLNLGFAYSELGRIDEAKASVQRAIDLARNPQVVAQAKMLQESLDHPRVAGGPGDTH